MIVTKVSWTGDEEAASSKTTILLAAVRPANQSLPDHWTRVLGLGTQVDSSRKFGDSGLDSDSEGKYLRLDLDSGENDFKLASTCDMVTWMTHIALPFVTV